MCAHTHTRTHTRTHTHTGKHTHTHVHPHTVCSDLTLENGAVRYLPAGRPDIESMAIHICNPGYRLSSPQVGNTRTCSMNGWTDQNFTCEREYIFHCCISSIAVYFHCCILQTLPHRLCNNNITDVAQLGSDVANATITYAYIKLSCIEPCSRHFNIM